MMMLRKSTAGTERTGRLILISGNRELFAAHSERKMQSAIVNRVFIRSETSLIFLLKDFLGI